MLQETFMGGNSRAKKCMVFILGCCSFLRVSLFRRSSCTYLCGLRATTSLTMPLYAGP